MKLIELTAIVYNKKEAEEWHNLLSYFSSGKPFEEYNKKEN